MHGGDEEDALEGSAEGRARGRWWVAGDRGAAAFERRQWKACQI